jgi:hypothetical protein
MVSSLPDTFSTGNVLMNSWTQKCSGSKAGGSLKEHNAFVAFRKLAISAGARGQDK